ncbi:uncharacterized mitochondrial protein-like protein [Tanacetum coccineum]
MLVQVYVDDIIFGSSKKSICTEFEECMHKRFQMSSMGEVTFFLGLQVKQQSNGIFISQDKYVADILKKFDFLSIRTATTPIESNMPLVKDDDGVDVDVHVYRSMIGSLMYLTASRPDIMFALCLIIEEPALTENQQQLQIVVGKISMDLRMDRILRKDRSCCCQFLTHIWSVSTNKLQLARCNRRIHNLSDAEKYADNPTLGYVTDGAVMDQAHAIQHYLTHSLQSPPYSPSHYLPPRSYTDEAPLPEGNISGSTEASIQLKELIVLVPNLVTKSSEDPEFKKLMKIIESFVPMTTESKSEKDTRLQLEQETSKKQKIDIEDDSITKGKDKVVKEEEAEVPVKKTGKRRKQKARKGINIANTAQDEMYDRVLWGDLKTMFDPPLSDDAIWSLPLQQKIIN